MTLKLYVVPLFKGQLKTIAEALEKQADSLSPDSIYPTPRELRSLAAKFRAEFHRIGSEAYAKGRAKKDATP